MKFGKHFERELVPQWRQHYIQYNDLKRWIKKAEQSGDADGKEFNQEVEDQVNDVIRFYREQLALLQTDVEAAERQRALLAQSHEPKRTQRTHRESLLLEYHRLGEQLLQIFHYLELNSTSLRKITKKFSKRIHTTSANLLNRVESNQDSPLAKNLKRMKDFSLLQPFVDKIREGILDLQSALRASMRNDERETPRAHAPPNGQFGSAWSEVPAVRFKQYKRHGHAILQDLSLLREKLQESTSFLDFLSLQAAIPFHRRMMRSQSAIARARRHQAAPLPGDRSGVLGGPLHAGDSLSGNQSAPHAANGEAEKLAGSGKRGLVGPESDYSGAALTDSEEDDEEEADVVSEYINLASTFFYLCNYNVCLPTSGEYAAHMGLNASMSGVIVAMTPVAAMLSAIGYSFWSNHSFKAPLLCSSSLLICGNLLYGLAWDADVTAMILLGRFVTGLGGARAVNRRYIADSIPVEHRTRASAAFVAAGALGMASGPFLASVFSGIDLVILGITMNEMTAPSFFMVLVWALYAGTVIMFFKEPSKGPSKLGSGSGGGNGTPQSSVTGDSSVYDEFFDDDDDEDSLLDAMEGGFPSSSSSYVSPQGPWSTTRRGLFNQRSEDEAFNDGIDIVLDAPSASADDEDAAHEESLLLKDASFPRAGTGQDLGSSSEDLGSYGSFVNGSSVTVRKASRMLGSPMEYKPLLSKEQMRARRHKVRTRLTILCLWIIFWVKLVQEALLTALPLTLPDFLAWGPGRVGILMACLGLSVVPFNVIIVQVSRRYGFSDSFWVRYLQIPLIVGASLLAWDGARHQVLLFIGYFVVFISSQVMEAVVMAYFSKVIDAKLAAGTFNSGLLATESGTLGRAAGNAIITVLHNGTPLGLQQNLYGLDAIVTVPTVLVSIWLCK